MSASLDTSLDPMAEIRFRKKHGSLWMEIQKETHFTYDELEHIMVIFFKIQKRDEKPSASDHISRAHFRDVLHTGMGMTDAYMMDRVMVALDRGTSSYVTMATFAKAMSLYLRGTLEEKIKYAFTCYDLLGEGYLRRETMYQLMKKSLAKASRDDDVEEAVKALLDHKVAQLSLVCQADLLIIDFLAEFPLRYPSLLRLANYAGHIIVDKCMRRHKCITLFQWDGNPTRPERNQAQDRRLNVISEARRCNTANLITLDCY